MYVDHGLRIKLFGYRWVCVTNRSGQQIVIPFYVCEVKQPILSATRLVEQGFQLTLDGGSRDDNIAKGSKATSTQHRTRTDWHDSTDRNAHTTRSFGHRICRRRLAVQNKMRTCQRTINTGGIFFTPSRTQRPVPAEQLGHYRKTTIRFKDGATNTFEDKCQTREAPNRAQQQMSKGETAFRIEKGTSLPETLQQQFATKTQPRSEPQMVTPQAIQHNPRTRLREKTTPPTLQESAAPHTTKGAAGHGLPHPSEVHRGGDHWYREGSYWKRVHIGPRATFYIPEQTHDPDIKRLTPWRQTKVQPVGDERNTRLVEDERTRQQAKTSDKPWTGWANFKEHQEFPTQLESDDEKQQQGTQAKATQAPKQPTPQDILDFRAQRDTPPLQELVSNMRTSERQTEQPPKAAPITQLDFGYIKGFDDSNVHPLYKEAFIRACRSKCRKCETFKTMQMEGSTSSTLCKGSFIEAPLKRSFIRKLYKTFIKKPF